MRRARVSIASNIAEGAGRNSRRDFLQFVLIARGSNNELQTQLLISQRLGYGDPEAHRKAQELAEESAGH